MPAFAEKYTQAQREAMAYAYVDRGIRPAKRVVELAARGELTHNGETLAPFPTNMNTVRDLARDLRKRRAGELKSDLASAPPRDAVEALRRRLVNMADAEVAVEEGRKAGERSPEKIRQLARTVLEIARLPGPTDPRPASPATRDENGKQLGAQTKGGLGGALLKAHRADTQGTMTEQDVKPNTTPNGDHNQSEAQHATPEPQTEHTASEPGVWVGEQVARLATEQG